MIFKVKNSFWAVKMIQRPIFQCRTVVNFVIFTIGISYYQIQLKFPIKTSFVVFYLLFRKIVKENSIFGDSIFKDFWHVCFYQFVTSFCRDRSLKWKLFFKDMLSLPKTDLSRLLEQQRLEPTEKKRLWFLLSAQV